MKLFKVISEYDIGSEENPYELILQASCVKKVHRYLEDYCCGVGEDYESCLEDGLFRIQEVTLEDVVLTLD